MRVLVEQWLACWTVTRTVAAQSSAMAIDVLNKIVSFILCECFAELLLCVGE